MKSAALGIPQANRVADEHLDEHVAFAAAVSAIAVLNPVNIQCLHENGRNTASTGKMTRDLRVRGTAPRTLSQDLNRGPASPRRMGPRRRLDPFYLPLYFFV